MKSKILELFDTPEHCENFVKDLNNKELEQMRDKLDQVVRLCERELYEISNHEIEVCMKQMNKSLKIITDEFARNNYE